MVSNSLKLLVMTGGKPPCNLWRQSRQGPRLSLPTEPRISPWYVSILIQIWINFYSSVGGCHMRVHHSTLPPFHQTESRRVRPSAIKINFCRLVVNAIVQTSVVREKHSSCPARLVFRSLLANNPPKNDCWWFIIFGPLTPGPPAAAGWMFCGEESLLTVLADVDWKEIDMPESNEPTLPLLCCGFSVTTAKETRNISTDRKTTHKIVWLLMRFISIHSTYIVRECPATSYSGLISSVEFRAESSCFPPAVGDHMDTLPRLQLRCPGFPADLHGLVQTFVFPTPALFWDSPFHPFRWWTPSSPLRTCTGRVHFSR